MNEYGRLAQVLMKAPEEAFASQAQLAAQWRSLNFLAEPDFRKASREYDAFYQIVAGSGAEMVRLPAAPDTTPDSIYTRDACVLMPEGVVLCSMGKPQRTAEPGAQGLALEAHGVSVRGRIASPGLLEGGDVIWLAPDTVAIGEGKRTNVEGIRQFAECLGSTVTVITVPLPDWPSVNDVLHLMSLISPVDERLAVVYLPLLPAGLVRVLRERGYEFVEVPDEEFESMGTNVLAISPRECVVLRGNPRTRTALERAGAIVHEYDGAEISLKGGGGPTCLTRPLSRIG